MSDQPLHPVGSQLLYEDDKVRVWALEVAPGETFPRHLHDHDYVTISLAEGETEAHEADGSIRRNRRVPGDIQLTRVGSGQTHELKNVGTTVYRNRIIEFKERISASDVPPVNVNILEAR
ncbi:MAG: hypothetical protein U0821_21995 [Chloroflexota bacterium]